MPLNPFFDPKVILELIKRFFSDTVKTILLLALVAIGVLFTYLYKNQESEKIMLKENWAKCENGNYQRDVKIDGLIIAKAKVDSTLNRILGRLEAIDELKKSN